MSTSRAFVVAVSGTSGSGKSTLVRGLVDGLRTIGGLTVGAVFFDDYAGVSDLPENDLTGWLDRGGDPDEWRTDRLAADLAALRAGGAVPSLDVIVLEEPFGRARTAMGPMIDLALHIELPLHVALARRLTRHFVPVGGEVPAEQADRLRGYLAMYWRTAAPCTRWWTGSRVNRATSSSTGSWARTSCSRRPWPR